MGGYAVVFAVSTGLTFLLVPLVRKLAFRIGAVKVPSARDVHTTTIPELGGAAMFLGFLVAMAVASQIPQFREMFDGSSEPAGVILAAGVMFATGALDDLRDVSPPAKIAGMVLAGSLLSLFGVSMLFFHVPFSGADVIVLSPDLAPLVTVVTVVVFANAINLIDGLDGLAAGIVIIAGTALFLYSTQLFDNGFLEGSNVAPLIAVIAVGVCVGFLPWNFNPARIFMGDAGALFLGLLMAVTTITIGGRADYQYTGTTYFFFAPLVIPLLILGVPIVDTTFSFLRRVLRGHSFSVADKDHLHHRLMRLGHGPRRTVVLLWLWTALLSGLALIPTYFSQGNANALVPIGALALALLLYVFFFPGRKEAQAIAAEEEAEAEAEAAEEEAAAARSQVIDLGARRRGTGNACRGRTFRPGSACVPLRTGPSLGISSQAQLRNGAQAVVGTGVRVRNQLEQAAKSVRTSAKVRDDGLSQAFEFAAGPVVMGLIGWLVDTAAGTAPLFLIVFAVFGVIGSFVSFYYRYQAQTARLDEGKPWTRRTH